MRQRPHWPGSGRHWSAVRSWPPCCGGVGAAPWGPCPQGRLRSGVRGWGRSGSSGCDLIGISERSLTAVWGQWPLGVRVGAAEKAEALVRRPQSSPPRLTHACACCGVGRAGKRTRGSGLSSWLHGAVCCDGKMGTVGDTWNPHAHEASGGDIDKGLDRRVWSWTAHRQGAGDSLRATSVSSTDCGPVPTPAGAPVCTSPQTSARCSRVLGRPAGPGAVVRLTVAVPCRPMPSHCHTSPAR